MMLQRYFVLVFVFVFIFDSFLVSAIKFDIPQQSREKDSWHWYTLAREDLEFALNRKLNNKVAKNIIFFLGDGMGITVTSAGRIFKGQQKGYSGEEENLVWDKFPNAGFSKTYNLNKQVPDSAATATAYFGGVKTNFQTLGVSGAVNLGDCKASLVKKNRIDTILKWAQDAGKDTGIVTSTRITHATPAALYSHCPHRDWECDEKMKFQTEFNVDGCKDIARQLVEDEPGKSLKVILGGGRRQMGASLPDDTKDCLRNDSRNLVEEWLSEKRQNGNSAEYVVNNQQLDNLVPERHDFIMGLFSGSHMPFAYEKKGGPADAPTLKKMTEAAIRRLQRDRNGYFLMVEGGRIDHGLHNTQAQVAFLELLEFEEAVKTALEMTSDEDTLIIVTADHSHVMTMNGYPDRGNDILGLTTLDDATDKLPYTTLMFTIGFGTNYSWDGEKAVRQNLTNVNTRDINFVPQTAVHTPIGRETHGGEDVAIYATGPMAHLFHRVHEQSYIAHVMAYAACVGPYKYDCQRPGLHIYEDDENDLYEYAKPSVDTNTINPEQSRRRQRHEENQKNHKSKAHQVSSIFYHVLTVVAFSISRCRFW